MCPPAEYKYYAFISYSRKNSKVAAFLHRGFEKFRIPSSKIPASHLPSDKKYLRPVFRDKRDLEVSENNFSDDIKQALETSKYLIVICSPEAAGSKWVNEEILYFLETHNNDLGLIVPVIFKGIPGNGDQDECLPPGINCREIRSRNLPRMLPDDGETERQGWQNGLIQAISYMLHVKRENIKTSIDAERIRFYQKCVFIAIVTLLIFIGLAGWALIAQKGKLLAEAETARMIEIAQETDALRKKAEENEKRAIAGEKEARRQADIAKKNEAEAKRQADIIKKQSEASQLNFIGKMYADQGKYADALEYYKKALDIQKKILPDDSQAIASSYYDIGRVYSNQGNLNTALEYYQKALAIFKKILPGNHPDIALSYNNIGLVYSNQGNYTAALEYYQKALAILKKTLPENHPSIASIYNNIGIAYNNKVCYKCSGRGSIGGLVCIECFGIGYVAQTIRTALKSFQTALKIYELVLPENHPEIAQAYNNIGMVFYRKKDYENAHKHLKKACEIAKKSLGEQHPTTQLYLKNLKMLEQKLKKNEK